MAQERLNASSIDAAAVLKFIRFIHRATGNSAYSLRVFLKYVAADKCSGSSRVSLLQNWEWSNRSRIRRRKHFHWRDRYECQSRSSFFRGWVVSRAEGVPQLSQRFAASATLLFTAAHRLPHHANNPRSLSSFYYLQTNRHLIAISRQAGTPPPQEFLNHPAYPVIVAPELFWLTKRRCGTRTLRIAH